MDKRRFLTRCACGRTTTHKYANAHGGLCKWCVDGKESSRDSRQARIIDSGWDAYAREEGHYDLPDHA